jgi:hypothetical protein
VIKRRAAAGFAGRVPAQPAKAARCDKTEGSSGLAPARRKTPGAVRHSGSSASRRDKPFQGGLRYDLAGQPRGAVTPAQQERARQELAAWQAQRLGRTGRTRYRSNPPDSPTLPADGEQSVTHRTAVSFKEKE